MSDVRCLLFVPETVEHMARATPNEVRQLVANAHVTTDNPADPSGERRLLIGRTDGGRVLTVVIEATLDPTTWLPVTAWDSDLAERKILERSV